MNEKYESRISKSKTEIKEYFISYNTNKDEE